MLNFRYKARALRGDLCEGTLEAESSLAALEQLANKGLFPLEVQEHQNRPARVGSREVVFYTRQLADRLDAEVPLVKALDLVRAQSTQAGMQAVLACLHDRVKEGESFSQALGRYPNLFSILYRSLVSAGEHSGQLAVTIQRLAEFLEQDREFRSRLSAALAYPALIGVMGAATIVFLMLFAVPRMAELFADMEQSIPWSTQLLIRLSGLFSGWGLLLMLLPLLGVWKLPWKRLLLHVPVWGGILQKASLARFARTLATLLSGGVPIVQALGLVAPAAEQSLLRGRLEAMAREVEQGKSLAASLKQIPGVPVFLCHMVSVGEEVNSLEKSLDKAAAAYERDVDRSMKMAVSLLEPCMILLVGSVVGLLVMTMLLPIFQVSALVR